MCCKLSSLLHFITGGRLPGEVSKEDGEIGHGTTCEHLRRNPNCYCRGDMICPARQLVKNNEKLDECISHPFPQRHSIGGLSVTFPTFSKCCECMCFGRVQEKGLQA